MDNNIPVGPFYTGNANVGFRDDIPDWVPFFCMPGESTSHQIILKENEAKTQNKAKKSNGKILNQKKKKIK